MKKNGHRLAFLVVETEPGQALSTRKLLLESAKHNVLTAHSTDEGAKMFGRFPNVDAVVIDADLKGADRLAKVVKDYNSRICVLGLTSRIGALARWADETLSPHDPAELLKCLEKLGGRTDI